MLEGIVLWKPLYYTTIGMFILSLILLPLSSIWSLIIIFVIITLWSRIPGSVLYIFRQGKKLAKFPLFERFKKESGGE